MSAALAMPVLDEDEDWDEKTLGMAYQMSGTIKSDVSKLEEMLQMARFRKRLAVSRQQALDGNVLDFDETMDELERELEEENDG
jgi:hypothetical protein